MIGARSRAAVYDGMPAGTALVCVARNHDEGTLPEVENLLSSLFEETA